MLMRICSNMHRHLYKNMLKIMRKSCNIYPKLIQNPSKIDKIRALGRFGAFSRPGRLQDASRTSPYYAFWSLLAETGAQKGSFLGPAWIQNGSKIAFLSIDRRLDPPKMTSGRGFGKNMKIWWKIDANIEGFWWLRTTFGVILFAYFTLLPFSGKAEKWMPKGDPQFIVVAGRDRRTPGGKPANQY